MQTRYPHRPWTYWPETFWELLDIDFSNLDYTTNLLQYAIRFDPNACRPFILDEISGWPILCEDIINCLEAIPWYAPFTSLNVDAGGNIVWWPDNDAQTLSIDCDTNELSISNGNTIDLSCLWLSGTYLNNTNITVDYDIWVDLDASVPLAQRAKSHIFLVVDISAGNVVISNLTTASAWVKDWQQVSFTITANDPSYALTVNSLYGNVLFESIGDVCTLTWSDGNWWLVS